MPRIAILDDYQEKSLEAADWDSITDADVIVFTEFLGHDIERVAEILRSFDIIVAMRERTKFPSYIFSNLPNLKLLVTTGMRNGSIDMLAARAQLPPRGSTHFVFALAPTLAPAAAGTWSWR